MRLVVATRGNTKGATASLLVTDRKERERMVVTYPPRIMARWERNRTAVPCRYCDRLINNSCWVYITRDRQRANYCTRAASPSDWPIGSGRGTRDSQWQLRVPPRVCVKPVNQWSCSGAVAAGMTSAVEGAGLERNRDQGDREKEGGGHRYRLGSFRGSPPLEPRGPPCLCYPV